MSESPFACLFSWLLARREAEREPYGFGLALKAVANGDDLDYITFHGLTHREVIQSYVERRAC